MSSIESTQRFFRPADAGRARRNYRRVQVQRLLVVFRNAVIVAGAAVGLLALYRHTQSGAQFAVKKIEVDGAVHAPRAAIEAITRQYAGLNLFNVDIARVRRDIGALPWVRRVEIEEKVPDTLRIRIVERTPAALVMEGGLVRYVDDDGVTFADLSPAVGDADLPVIVSREDGERSPAQGRGVLRSAQDDRELARCVSLLRDLRARDPLLYARLSEVRPIAPRGFAIFDRELGTFLYANAEDLTAKWRDLYAIVASEKLGPGALEYADLRFDGRIVVKPLRPASMAAAPAPKEVSNAITN